MNTFSRFALAVLTTSILASTANAIEVRPAYSAPKANENSWARGISAQNYGLKRNAISRDQGLYIGADLSYIVADGVEDYPTRFGGGGVFLGYRYNRFFALEGSYSRTNEGERVLNGTTTHSTLQQMSVDALGMFPLNNNLTAIAGLGYGLITEEYDQNTAGIRTSHTEDGSAIRLTGGLEYAITPNTAVRGLVRYIAPGDQVNDRLDNLWSYNLGLKYRF